MAVHGSESRVKAGEIVWQYTVHGSESRVKAGEIVWQYTVERVV